jgi:Zn-finger nucleic acid-binding protein
MNNQNRGLPMRLLVECPECRRQYDASRRPVGSRFRCHCGHVVEVRRAEGHDARVVRCSACGAARAEGADHCPYCGAGFSLHDRDLETVCPHCLARISDQAKFCHHCGTPLTAEHEAGKETDLICPACAEGQRLISRQVGTERTEVFECPRCAGFWMGHDAFKRFVERSRQEALPGGMTPETPQQIAARFGLPAGRAMPAGGDRGTFYRPCAVCHEMMVRRNFGHDSAVLIDLCREHGIWFDADELARILVWLRAGGKEREPAKMPAGVSGDMPLTGGHTLQHREGFFERLLSALFGRPDWD